ncbi:MAG: bifunctional DNA-formamidopyrimidine glycosylase/DNA-(apurinic or apyrimidinic site) lyase [Hyphomicrobiales bacterium]|nr:bifunctional DNA-formamidopyrimidine glycosylase/DNA-(apurinic or apyrimidinic site) lyase [Hyphomicrobiales bacterium]
MPELPEVETVKRGLEPVVTGARMERVELNRGDIRFPFPPRMRERLAGRRVLKLGRRAKYLLFHLDSGETLIAHLGMSGSFRIERDSAESTPGVYTRKRSKDPKHDHVVFRLDNGATITYNDPRRFGFMDLAKTGELERHPRLIGLGAEPLAPTFDAGRLAELFAGARAPLKSALLDQRRIAGLGNIYACEALFRARLAPSRAAGELAHARGRPTAKAKALARAIHEVLTEAVEAGGSTLRDHRRADGELGYFQHRFAVYDREGQPCLRKGCRGVVARAVGAGRSTFYCPICQK